MYISDMLAPNNDRKTMLTSSCVIYIREFMMNSYSLLLAVVILRLL